MENNSKEYLITQTKQDPEGNLSPFPHEQKTFGNIIRDRSTQTELPKNRPVTLKTIMQENLAYKHKLLY